MKRAENKSSTPETPVKKVKETVAVKTVSKKLTAPEPLSVNKAKKPVSAKVPELKKAVISKKHPAIFNETPAQKIKEENPSKKPVAAPKLSKATIIDKKVKSPKEKIEVKVKAAKEQFKVAVEAKTTPKTKQTKSEVSLKKAKTIEKKVEIVAPPIIEKPIKKKIKPIGSAVVRGKSGQYAFEVFSLDAEIKDGSAIYLISKRMTDKNGRGHHKFVCIGQTESLLGDIKKHAKDKCIKQHKANVVCLLREENEKNRLKIETDLRQAHTIACNHQQI